MTAQPNPSDFDYVAEADLTANGMWAPHNCGAMSLNDALVNYVAAAKALDPYKKLLFRGRTAGECGLGDQSLYRLHNVISDEDKEIVHGIIGLATESGELVETLRDKIVHGKPFDQVNIREEIGDCLWYISRLVKWSKTTFFAEMVRNIRKLRARHGNAGFNRDADINRNLDAERKVLEAEIDDNDVEPAPSGLTKPLSAIQRAD